MHILLDLCDVIYFIVGQATRHAWFESTSEQRHCWDGKEVPQEVCGSGYTSHAGSWVSRRGADPM